MTKYSSTKPKNVNYFCVPRPLWRLLKKHLPKPPQRKGPGRLRIDNRAVINGIWYVLWTGCQWKAVHKDWFGVSSSVLHARFQTWQRLGIWDKVLTALVRFYARKRHVGWEWQSIDSKSCPAPLGGAETGKNPTDRAKLGSKIHILVDQRGAPLAVHITGANEHDKWSADDLLFSIVYHVQQANNACVQIRAMTILMCIKWSEMKTTFRISNTADDVESRSRKQVLSLAKHDIRLDAG